MKIKRLSLFILALLVITITICSFITSCTGTKHPPSAETKKETIITKENFEDYFQINVNDEISVKTHEGGFVIGTYIPTTYSGTANVDVNVYATSPIDSYNVSVTLEIYSVAHFWGENHTITLKLNSNGSASHHITMDTLEKTLDNSFKDNNFYARIVSAEGKIIQK